MSEPGNRYSSYTWDSDEERYNYEYILGSVIFTDGVFYINSEERLSITQESLLSKKLKFIEQETKEDICNKENCIIKFCCSKMCKKYHLTVSYKIRQEIGKIKNECA